MKILVAGYPFIRENFFKTFDAYTGEYFFLLPKQWKAKGGEVIFYPPQRSDIITARAWFYHSHYPFIGGILKGWMPAFPVVLWKHRKDISVVYSPLEPVLLSALYQAFWSKVLRKKHIIFTWENIPYSKYRGLNGIMKRVMLCLNLWLSDSVVCGNHKAQEIISERTRKPTVVIPLSGVDTDFFDPARSGGEVRTKYYIGDRFTFSFMGALGFRKGIHLIIDAFAIIRRKYPDAHLIIAGSGEYGGELEKQIERLQLRERVTMIPWADMALVRDILSATDVFLYPSISYGGWEEQFGYSIAEAMSMAVPVISTRSGSIGELVADGKTGILIRPDDVQQLAEAMALLHEDHELRRRFGQAGRDLVQERFSYPVIARQFHSFFTSLR